MLTLLLAAVIELTGVTANDLRARAYFDANNVKVGDPMVLTVDFIGAADFASLHPPALSRHLDRKTWKLDDASAKTDTAEGLRSITYRVRPMRQGVLHFPALQFSYFNGKGERREIRSNAIPVHAKRGTDVVVAEMAEDPNAMPEPPALAEAVPEGFGEDESFAWRKACSKPTAKAFAAFDGPSARMNEATCAVREGNWSRALSIYRLLEWRTGQTPEIERGIVAALALKYDNPQAELPVWRQVLRPILRYNGLVRAAIVLGGFAAIALLFWLLGRGLRWLACLTVACAVAGSSVAETTETVTTNADGSVTRTVRRTSGNGSFSFSSSTTTGGTGSGGFSRRSLFDEDPFEMFGSFPFGGRSSRRARPKADIGVRLYADKSPVAVGETFRLILAVERPRYVALTEGLNLTIAEMDSLQQLDGGGRERPVRSENPTNVIERTVFLMRANEPLTNLTYAVRGGYLYAGDNSFFARPNPIQSSGKARLTVLPLPDDGRPGDFSGIVAERVSLEESCDLQRVETNDVITISYAIRAAGFVPRDFLIPDAAFEWRRGSGGAPGVVSVVDRRYFVADGAKRTPPVKLTYYDPVGKRYRTVETHGRPVTYGKGR